MKKMIQLRRQREEQLLRTKTCSSVDRRQQVKLSVGRDDFLRVHEGDGDAVDVAVDVDVGSFHHHETTKGVVESSTCVFVCAYVQSKE